ncbi:27078_t:CDS:1, partial [Racocetra persica]
MITPNDRVNENEEYKKIFYIEGESLYCTFCKCIINYKNKFLLDQHLKTDKHKTNKHKAKGNPQEINKPAPNINTCREERDAINIDLIHALTRSNILLEKVDKLKPFFLKY